HFHTDHPVFSCSKIEQKQLSTWVSFQSAEQSLLGQFSVSGNTPGNPLRIADCKGSADNASPFLPRAFCRPGTRRWLDAAYFDGATRGLAAVFRSECRQTYGVCVCGTSV
ncbi:hypothetical protein, partial [Stutzerimonas stutzeri]|uniref:hypothetical protein n=1 Tax=Stutzerimonas stutzeri TaxID=316 RepID=UPI002555B479